MPSMGKGMPQHQEVELGWGPEDGGGDRGGAALACVSGMILSTQTEAEASRTHESPSGHPHEVPPKGYCGKSKVDPKQATEMQGSGGEPGVHLAGLYTDWIQPW